MADDRNDMRGGPRERPRSSDERFRERGMADHGERSLTTAAVTSAASSSARATKSPPGSGTTSPINAAVATNRATPSRERANGRARP